MVRPELVYVSLLALAAPRDVSSSAFAVGPGPGDAGGTHARRHWEDHALRRRYECAGGFAYRQSCLPPDEFRSVRDELDRLDLALEPETGDSFATRRVGAAIPPGGPIHAVMGGGSMCRLVNRLEGGGGDEWTLSPDVPIELRVYETGGSGMEWHFDDVLFDEPQVGADVDFELRSNSLTCGCRNSQLPGRGRVHSGQHFGLRHDVEAAWKGPGRAGVRGALRADDAQLGTRAQGRGRGAQGLAAGVGKAQNTEDGVREEGLRAEGGYGETCQSSRCRKEAKEDEKEEEVVG